MKKIFLVIFSITLLSGIALLNGCSKMEEKKPLNNNQQNMSNQQDPHQNMQNPHTDMNQSDGTQMMDSAPEGAEDPKADELSKGAYDYEKVYEKNKDDNTKKELIQKHMAAGNYLMFDANLSPKKKYRPALKHYRRVLQLDPANAEAERNKQQIVEIYNQMGRPVPND